MQKTKRNKRRTPNKRAGNNDYKSNLLVSGSATAGLPRGDSTGRRSTLSVVDFTSGFADRADVTLRYAGTYTLTPGTLDAEYIFSGNSGYDPDVTSTGTQPLGWDVWATAYEAYQCVSSAISVTPIIASPATGTAVSLCVFASRDAAPMPYGTAILQTRSKATAISKSAQPPIIRCAASTAEILGLNPTSAQVVNVNDLTSGPPLVQWYWTLVATAFGGATNTLICTVTIDYRIRFSQRYALTSSLLDRLVFMQDVFRVTQSHKKPNCQFGVPYETKTPVFIDSEAHFDAATASEQKLRQIVGSEDEAKSHGGVVAISTVASPTLPNPGPFSGAAPASTPTNPGRGWFHVSHGARAT